MAKMLKVKVKSQQYDGKFLLVFSTKLARNGTKLKLLTAEKQQKCEVRRCFSTELRRLNDDD